MNRDYGERTWVTFDQLFSDNPNRGAICVNNDGDVLWIPRSLIFPEHEHVEVEKDGRVNVNLPIWFSEQEDLI